MTDLAADQEALLRALTHHRVEFVVIGGVAAQIYGWRGATSDLDIAVSDDEANVSRLNKALAEVGAREPAVGALGTVFVTRHGRLEVVARADGIGDYAAWLTLASEQVVADTLTVMVAAPEDILRSKQASGRKKDWANLPQIRRDLIESGSLKPEAAGDPIAEPDQATGPPPFVTQLLGDRPKNAVKAAVWDGMVQIVLEYRSRWRIDDSDNALGTHVPQGDEAIDRENLEAHLERGRRRLNRRA